MEYYINIKTKTTSLKQTMKNFTNIAFIAGFIGTFAGLMVAFAPTNAQTTLECGNTAALEAPCKQTAEINPTF